MQELIKGMLPIRPWLAEDELSGAVRQQLAINRNALAIGLLSTFNGKGSRRMPMGPQVEHSSHHVELLNVRRKTSKCLRVWQYCSDIEVKVADVPHT